MNNKDQITVADDFVMVELHVFTKKGEKYWIASAPSLEVVAQGTTMEKARLAFEEALNIFLEETRNSHSLATILSDLGWSQQGSIFTFSRTARATPKTFSGVPPSLLRTTSPLTPVWM